MSLERPLLLDLFQRSEEALQGGQQLCARAHTFTQDTANTAIAVFSLDAQVRWLSDAVIEQLKLALLVAKDLEEKQTHLSKQVQAWDTERAAITDSLDTILDSLGVQYVPPSFHQTSADSSLFGSQSSPSPPASPVLNGHSLPGDPQSPRQANGVTPSTSPLRNGHAAYTPVSPEQSPSATLRGVPFRGIISSKDKGKEKSRGVHPKQTVPDRKRWKTLRDFVDDRAIEDILDNIENERIALDKTLNESLFLSETLRTNIDAIHASLPGTLPLELCLTSPSAPTPSTPITSSPPSTQARVKAILEGQEKISANMAAQLESLASHYSQMSEALDDGEAGMTFEDEDIRNMNRDTEELPRILEELRESAQKVERSHEQLTEAQETTSNHLQQMHTVLDDLQALGDIMTDMLKVQQDLEVRAGEQLISLESHLHTVSELHGRYVAYQIAFAKLVLELERRAQYRDAAENLVREMAERLQSMSEEETHLRDRFNAEHGAFLPEDLCLCVGNPPTRWEVTPWEGEGREVLPDIDRELLVQARDRVGYSESRPEVDSI
ncbi:hypothetical protein BDN72DRAFT_271834 [Pluteus cervinus]|uniref:Uncharacterized protein n=1 Tax=Pluteus cervinus TaxID=181527 RepID=A0ACD3B4B2_9AGAR|nr:hypothetical protein BDN72DRAFT_271834 [Pluteus cervinus]